MVATAIATLRSLSLYSQSKPSLMAKRPKETADAFEARTWHYRIHQDDEGVIIPAMCFKNCLSEAAKFLSIQIPGKGKSTYTKHFEAGVLVSKPVPIFSPQNGERIIPPSEKGLEVAAASIDPEAKDVEYSRPPHEMYGDWIFTPADGVAGGGKRVWKCYPMINGWRGDVVFTIMDDTITQDVFKNVLQQAGMLIGIGRFRVRNRGTYGTFAIEELQWKEGFNEIAA